MFTRSQAKLFLEKIQKDEEQQQQEQQQQEQQQQQQQQQEQQQQQQQQQQQEQQQQQQQDEKIFVVVDRIKKYLIDADKNNCEDCFFQCDRIQNKIRKIDELYEYLLSNEIKQDFFVSLFASYSRFIPSIFAKTKQLKNELVQIIKVEKIQEHLKNQKSLMKKLNKTEQYL